jgi:hypothetical protein
MKAYRWHGDKVPGSFMEVNGQPHILAV